VVPSVLLMVFQWWVPGSARWITNVLWGGRA